MIEREALGYGPKVEVSFNTEQATPFAVKKDGPRWQLSVNRSHFEARGFLPDEINGAIFLEEERLSRQTSVTTQEEVQSLRRWQDLAADDPKAAAFKAAFEKLAALSSLEDRDAEKAASSRKYLEKLAARMPGEALTDQLFSAVLQKELGLDLSLDSRVVETVLNNLQKEETIEGKKISPLDTLSSPNISSGTRTSWFQSRFLPRLQFLEKQYKAKTAEAATENQQTESSEPTEEAQTPPPTPQSAQDEYEQHRGREEKGKGGQPIFVIDPSYTGYWEEDSFDSINESNGRLIKNDTQRIKTGIGIVDGPNIEGTQRMVSGYTGTELFSLPLAPTFRLTQEGLNSFRTQGIEVFTDAEGHTFIKPSSNIQFQAEVAISTTPKNNGITSKDNAIVEQNLPPEIYSELLRINSLALDSFGKIQTWVDFMKSTFRYPPDDQVESMYQNVDNSSSRIGAMTEGKLLDCFLAREFFLAGLKRLHLPDIEWRGVNGHLNKAVFG
jgi:hypothetical protein